MSEWSFPAVHDLLVAAHPDREMLVSPTVRRTAAEVQCRSRGLAAFLAGRGLGAHTERADLARWESGQDAVALVQSNGTDYVEAMYGCFRARTVPFNVNHHYRPTEMQAVFDMTDVKAVLYHRRLGPLVEAGLAGRAVVLVHIDDGTDTPPLPGSAPYEETVATPGGEDLPPPSPDDLYIVCTGGTTGTPKAVLWRQADVYVSGMGGRDDATPESIVAAADAGGPPWFATPPLMHVAAQMTAFNAIHQGFAVVTHDDRGSLDVAEVLRTAERERVTMLIMVGDAYARPIIEELRRGSYDLSGLRSIGTGGAATNDTNKAALLELLPHVMVVDGYGSSETGGMASGPNTAAQRVTRFLPGPGATVLAADRSRFLEPGDDEVGWVCRRGRVPLGYLGDREKTEATFPMLDGERLAVPGDRARLHADGTIELLGRDAMVVNTGGEKVFVEEVEAVLRQHPEIADALVIGRPSEKFGQEVVAVVELRPGSGLDAPGVREYVGGELARFKAPRAVAFADRVQRLAQGKADYAWAAVMAASAIDATGGGRKDGA